MSLARRDLWLLPAGFLIAFVGALCGIGGGLFAVPILHFLRGLELKSAVATALVLVLATTTCATITEALRAEPDLHWRVVGCTAAGVLFGAQLGFFVARRIGTRTLKAVFVVVLAVAGYRLLFASGGVAIEGADGDAWIDTTAFLVAVAAGFGGGFLAPLLGIGGGLLMVPALFLGVDGMGFGEARATSLAAGSLGALRSVVLHGRDGRVHLPAVAPLALGAVFGAACGVFVVHAEGVVAFARVLLGGILWFVAARFAWELRKPAEPGA